MEQIGGNEQSVLPQREEAVLSQREEGVMPQSEEAVLPEASAPQISGNEEGNATIGGNEQSVVPQIEEVVVPESEEGVLPPSEEALLPEASAPQISGNEEINVTIADSRGEQINAQLEAEGQHTSLPEDVVKTSGDGTVQDGNVPSQADGEQITAQLEAEGQQTSLPEDVVKTSGDDTVQDGNVPSQADEQHDSPSQSSIQAAQLDEGLEKISEAVKAIEGAEKANSGEEQDKKTKSVVAKVEGKVPSEAVGQKKGGVTTRSSSKLLIKSANVQDNVPQIVGKDVEVCNLGDMDGPSFSLGLSPEVQIPAEDKTKEVEKVDVETNQLKSRSKVLGAKLVYERVKGRRRGRKSIPETDTNVIEISSQEPEQQKPKRQKVIVVRRRKRVPMRRTMPKRGVNELKPPFRGTPFIHDLAKIDVPFIDWLPCTIAEYGDENLEFDEVHFKLNYPDWDFFSDSIFVDPTFESCSGKVPLPDKNWCYEHRDLVSVEVSNVLDSWVKKYFQFEVGEEDYPFKNNPSGLFMTIDQFRDLLFSNNEIGSEV
ncbi:hypothetical protein FCM35_KLT13898 [Carex littledalei]|uniref:Uncharacterized protein n=1 Tax=Carex littledalei TaxID=544730 RepID=A0A833QI03_9POAL|nr:hypothetical protein FCM35_KLT13898 [Carex littledalei]